MKITFNSAKELSHLLAAPASLAKKSTQKFSEYIALKFSDSEFCFTGSNGVTALEQRFMPSNESFTAHEFGSISVLSQKLTSCLKTFGDSKVTIETISKDASGNTLTQLVVKSGRTRLLCDTIDYALIPKPIESALKSEFKHLDVDFTAIQAGIHHIKHAMPTQHAKAMLNGIHFDASGSTLRLIATDGQRMANYSLKLSQEVPQDMAFTIPCHAITQLQTIAFKNARISVSSSALKISDGITSYQSALIDSAYPDMDRVVPKNGIGYIVVNRKDLGLMLDRVQISLLNESVPRLEINVNPDGKIECSAGEGKQLFSDEIQATHVQINRKVSMALNYRFIKDAISSMGTDEVVINMAQVQNLGNLNDGSYLPIITPASEQAKLFFTMIMPMR